MEKDNISLIRDLNKDTIKLDEFEKALQESGFDLPDEEFDEIEDEDGVDEDGVDAEAEMEYNDEDEMGLDDDELQEIVDWCEEECADLSDDELVDTLKDELEELSLEPEELDDTIDRVMTMLGRGESEDEIEGEDEISFDTGEDDEYEEECEY